MRLIDSALINQILDQATDRILRECGYDRGVHPETTPQSARDVVFAAPFPDLKSARCVNATVAGIEPEHHFAETHKIPSANTLRFDTRAVNHIKMLGYAELLAM